MRHVLLFCKEQAVNNILAIDVDGSHRSVRIWVSRRYVRMHLTSRLSLSERLSSALSDWRALGRSHPHSGGAADPASKSMLRPS